jgi:beta-phosphoglucomutase
MKAIIFDMDGVLVDSMPDHAEAWKKAFASVGIRIERKDIYELEGSNHRQIVELIFRHFGLNPTEEEIRELGRKKVEIFEKIEHVKPFEGIRELLSVLTPKYKLAVVSGSSRRTVHSIINTFFPDIFQVIIDGDDVTNSKPAPEPYLKAVEKLGVPKEQCLVIENAPLGIRSAKSAGLRCIAIPTYLDRAYMKEADVIVDSHKALKRAICEEEDYQKFQLTPSSANDP